MGWGTFISNQIKAATSPSCIGFYSGRCLLEIHIEIYSPEYYRTRKKRSDLQCEATHYNTFEMWPHWIFAPRVTFTSTPHRVWKDPTRCLKCTWHCDTWNLAPVWHTFPNSNSTILILWIPILRIVNREWLNMWSLLWPISEQKKLNRQW